MKKRVMALLLSISMLCSLLPTLALATSDETTPTDGTTTPTESTPVICQVCHKENCTEHTPCTTCGQADCNGQHENWCETCKKDNCGKTHIFCDTCQIYDCGVDHTASTKCEKCGVENCESSHENWCEICKKDNCGVDHSTSGICPDCGNAECTCEIESEVPLFVETLLATESLDDLWDLMMAEENKASVTALTPDELACVKTHVEALYNAVSEPSDDDTYNYKVLLETIAVLSGEEELQGDPEILPAASVLYVNSTYNSATEGYGTTHFSNYNSAYAYATANNTKATIVIEENSVISGFTFDNNHKNYTGLSVVIQNGAIMGNALSKWDMTYPVTVEAGGTLTMARPENSTVSNMHIKNILTIGEAGGATTYANFLSDTYQDGDMSIRYNGSVTLNNAVMTVQDLDAQGKFTATNSTITVDGAFASATSSFYPTTLVNSTMTVGGTQISGGLSDFAGGTNNQLGKVTMTDSTITFANGGATNVVVAGAVTLNGNSSIKCATIELTKSGSSLTFNDNSYSTATNIIISDKSAKVVGDKNLPVSLAESLQENYMLVYDEETRTHMVQAKGYSITYDLAGGTLEEGDSNPATYTATDSNITLKTPAKAGYTFAGWTGTGLNEATVTVTIPNGSTGDRSYTANWTENKVTISYQVVGTEESGSVTVETEEIGAATGTVQGSAATAAKQYRFVGWYSDAECTTPVNAGWVDSSNKLTPQKNAEGIYESATYYAKFERSEVDLTVTLSGGKSGSTYLFTLTGKTQNGDSVHLNLAAKGGETITVKDLPVGEYTITPDNNWNWRETVSVTVTGDLKIENATVAVSSVSNGKNQWLNGYAYAKK